MEIEYSCSGFGPEPGPGSGKVGSNGVEEGWTKKEEQSKVVVVVLVLGNKVVESRPLNVGHEGDEKKPLI